MSTKEKTLGLVGSLSILWALFFNVSFARQHSVTVLVAHCLVLLFLDGQLTKELTRVTAHDAVAVPAIENWSLR